ncbi:MAG: PaaI family thioesterase [Myxococcales bacterium]|nr:PaaI family thioesterase [Myxococcales bacterium]
MEARTHLQISPRLVGAPIALSPGRAEVALTTLPEMAADEHGLVHGGFIFGLADYAAMLAVNHPNVVLGGAELRFLKPVVVGDEVVAIATEAAGEGGKKRRVSVEVRRGDEVVLSGELTCFVLETHVLARRGAG